MLKALENTVDTVLAEIERELVSVGVIPSMEEYRMTHPEDAAREANVRKDDIKNLYDTISRNSYYEEMYEVLKRCDHAFACWQLGVVPGRPEDILALTSSVREVLYKVEGENG